MQTTLAIRQARPRAHPRKSICHGVRQLGAIAGELLALASLAAAMGTALLLLTGLIG